jgi:hypothetical protein
VSVADALQFRSASAAGSWVWRVGGREEAFNWSPSRGGVHASRAYWQPCLFYPIQGNREPCCLPSMWEVQLDLKDTQSMATSPLPSNGQLPTTGTPTHPFRTPLTSVGTTFYPFP